MKRFLFCVSAFALATPASAMPADLYGTIGYAHLDQDLRDTQLGAIQGRFGAKVTPHIGFEGEAAIGVSGDDYDLQHLPAGWYVRSSTDLNYQVAAYAVGYLPLSPRAELLARVGYGRTEFDHDWSNSDGLVEQRGTTTSHANTWNYGVGGQYYFDGRNGVRLDYTRHDASGDNRDVDVWSIGYTRHF